jgi:hypothetical protein
LAGFDLGMKKTLSLDALFLISTISVYPTVVKAQHKPLSVPSQYSSLAEVIDKANTGEMGWDLID